ncbi:hypothetical protein RHO12_03225 [Orbus sturtevantii]|uniref:hypothetical protein n=1 Tax=Orbus sturtevantii TaxID=3074109 RepID=UPI00370D118E
MSKWIITVLTAALLFVSYFAWNCWLDEKDALKEVNSLKSDIAELTKNNEKKELIIAEREKEKSQAINDVKKLQESLKNALKDNQCASEPIPSDVINWMRSGKN